MRDARSVTRRPLVRAVVISAVLVVALLGAMGGTAGAKASPASVAAPTQKAATRAAHALDRAERHFNCTDASRVINEVSQLQDKFAAHLAGLKAAQARAVAMAGTLTGTKGEAHQNHLAAFFGKRIAKSEKYQAHVLNPHFLAREARLSKLARAKCG